MIANDGGGNQHVGDADRDVPALLASVHDLERRFDTFACEMRQSMALLVARAGGVQDPLRRDGDCAPARRDGGFGPRLENSSRPVT